jgi:DNA-directed RNA polymerase subunit L
MDTDGPPAALAPGVGGSSLPDPSGATFAVEQEDHSLANALRFFLNKDARVAFAGYSMPHPTEDVVNVRVQTTGEARMRLSLACHHPSVHARSRRRRAPLTPAPLPSAPPPPPTPIIPPGQISATEALQSACTELQRVCDHVVDVFDRAVDEHKRVTGASEGPAEGAAPTPSKRPPSSSKKR